MVRVRLRRGPVGLHDTRSIHPNTGDDLRDHTERGRLKIGPSATSLLKPGPHSDLDGTSVRVENRHLQEIELIDRGNCNTLYIHELEKHNIQKKRQILQILTVYVIDF